MLAISSALAFPASATRSSRARAACRRASTRASTAASAPTMHPDKVRENRARMAAALGVAPEQSRHLLPDPFARGGRRPTTPWTRDDAPARRRHRDAQRRISRIGVSTADCGPVLFADARGRRDRRRACRLARRASPASSRRRSPRWKSSAPSAPRIAAALGPMIRQPNYEVGPEFVARFDGRRWRTRASSSRRRAKATRCSILPAYIAIASANGRHPSKSRTSASAPMRILRDSTATAASTLRGEPDYGRHINAIALAG